MSNRRIIICAICIVISMLFISATVSAVSDECPPEGCPLPKKDPQDEDEGEGGEEDLEYKEDTSADFKHFYYTFGLCGAYFIKKTGDDINGYFGAYTNIEYRISRLFSFGFDTYYAWLSGSGNQYLSSFNPGVKFYPLMYRNPGFEPFLFVGGHTFDAIFGDSSLGRMGMGQGGFVGAGFKCMTQSMPVGIEFFTRASFLYLDRSSTAGGGRGLAIPVFGFVGVTY